MKNIFTKPEKSFLLLLQNAEGEVSYSWHKTEEELQEIVNESLEYGDKIIDALEIDSCRKVEVVPDFLITDFIEDVYSAYETAKEQGFHNITIVINTNADVTYYINETKHGFQCDEFNHYFDDLDSVSTALYHLKMIGKIGCRDITASGICS